MSSRGRLAFKRYPVVVATEPMSAIAIRTTCLLEVRTPAIPSFTDTKIVF
jgi:hypothetical protein